jgi:NAD(P)-dependent dehydrogenase (short-subunit alcohol dehydrogenase family)
VAVVTGASSGLGRAVAEGLSALGARVWVVGRDGARTQAVAAELPGARAFTADLSDPAEVARLAAAVTAEHDQLAAVVHCAGALLHTHQSAPDGVEVTIATHLLAPFRLTRQLAPLLDGACVVIMSSGGMYSQRFDLAELTAPATGYDGVRAYAVAKRAQVVLSHELAHRMPGLSSYATHPGWTDTPGLTAGLPRFARLMHPLLRTPAQGADTAVWLAAGGARPKREGFWFDRRLRSEYRMPGTRPSGDPGPALFEWCETRR